MLLKSFIWLLCITADFFNNEKQQKRNKIIYNAISSTISKYSKKKGKRNLRDFGFDLDRIAHDGIIFASVRKYMSNEKKTFACLKKVLRNCVLS